MKRSILFILSLLSIICPATLSAAYVTKVVITVAEPVVGEEPSYKATVPQTASTEVSEVLWSGEFDNGRFILGNDYTMTVKLAIKSTSSNTFSATQKINATVNGHKARVSSVQSKRVTIKYTWKELGGPNPNNPKTKLKIKLEQLAAAYNATNVDNDKTIIKYIKSKLPGAEVWTTGGSYSYTRKIPSESTDGNIIVSIGITYDGVTIDNTNFKVVLPALSKSPEAKKLNADIALMKIALNNYIVSAKTTGKDILSVVNAAAVNGTKAEWGDNYSYTAPTAIYQGSIEGDIIFTLGHSNDYLYAHKTLPIAGDRVDAAIDADFSALSKALHNFNVNHSTTQQELVDVAMGALSNGTKLTLISFSKQEATYDDEGKIVLYFTLKLDGKEREPRIALQLPKLKATLPAELDVIDDEWEVLRLVNIERHKNGRNPLVMVAPLQDAANVRAEEHTKNNNIGHKRLDGSSCFTAIDATFRAGRKLGENLAISTTPSAVMTAWMNSSGHRENILSQNYHFIGIGTIKSSNARSWMQVFSSGGSVSSAVTNTGSTHFDTLHEMEQAYLICTTRDNNTTGYIPLDADYMVKDGNRYTIQLNNISVTVTVGE